MFLLFKFIITFYIILFDIVYIYIYSQNAKQCNFNYVIYLTITLRIFMTLL